MKSIGDFFRGAAAGAGAGGRCRVVGEVVELHAQKIRANLFYYDDADDAAAPESGGGGTGAGGGGGGGGGAPAAKPFAVLEGATVTRVAALEPRLQPAAAPSPAGGAASAAGRAARSAEALRSLGEAERVAAVLSELVAVGRDVVGAELDPAASLFDNGLNSLRAVEYISRLNGALGLSLSTRLVIGDAGNADVGTLAKAISAQIAGDGAPGAEPSSPRKGGAGGEESGMARAFPNVDRVSLRAIVAARLSKPKDRAFGIPVPKNLHKLPGALYYMARARLRRATSRSSGATGCSTSSSTRRP